MRGMGLTDIIILLLQVSGEFGNFILIHYFYLWRKSGNKLNDAVQGGKFFKKKKKRNKQSLILFSLIECKGENESGTEDIN